jgi:hypothetical protein
MASSARPGPSPIASRGMDLGFIAKKSMSRPELQRTIRVLAGDKLIMGWVNHDAVNISASGFSVFLLLLFLL